ncbi:MAG: hypothetical protein ACRD01_07440, partial [Terriglobales bacterium]
MAVGFQPGKLYQGFVGIGRRGAGRIGTVHCQLACLGGIRQARLANGSVAVAQRRGLDAAV